MINKEDYENSEKIEQDKEKFKEVALKNGFVLEDVLRFMEHYENLNPIKTNLVNLQEFLK